MKNIQKAIKRVHQIDALSKRTTILSAIHPTYKILIVLLYLIITASYSIHDLYILVMFLPLLLFSLLGEINLFKCLGELKPLVALLLFMGTPFLFFKGYGITCFIVLALKGIFALLFSYILMTTTSMEELCMGLSKLKVPQSLIVVIMLIQRYLILFFKETDKTLLAYSLRAPGQKGISIKTWGTLVGSMMLRSIDRAMNVYQSMMLRGFKGVMPLQSQKYDYKLSKLTFGIMCILLLFLKGVTL
ncbi:cobalt transport protein [Catenibacterium sp. CAG:290]|uniref:energy-coupling factor transporter transmembrane component T family protein n=1 Tax=Catenibacterium sp. TaxID=2049022 RepID=UPI0003414514|nr:cobalt transport protein [Catenibacterium sp. CAG:290]